MKKLIYFFVIIIIMFGCSDDPTDTDATCPEVTITYPFEGDTFSTGSIVSITAEASDNKAIEKVEFYLDEELLCSITDTEYRYEWDTTNNTGTHSIKAIAFDPSGNTEESEAINVTVRQFNLIISEVVNSSDDAEYKYVELFNSGTYSIDFEAENWFLTIQKDGVVMNSISLNASLPPKGVYLISFNSDVPDHDLVSSQISGDGNDGYFLYFGGDHESGILVDCFGVIDQNGTGQQWEYSSTIVTRNSDVSLPNLNWSSSEWTFLSPGSSSDATPGRHRWNSSIFSSEILIAPSHNSHEFIFPGIGNLLMTIDIDEPDPVNIVIQAIDNKLQENELCYNGYWNIYIDNNSTDINTQITYLEENLDQIPEDSLVVSANSQILLSILDTSTNQIQFDHHFPSFTRLTLHDSNIEIDPPLPVTLSSFCAMYSDDKPVLQWITQSEFNNAGWNVYRSESDDLSLSCVINSELIPGAGTTTEPTVYSFADEYYVEGGATYYYWLESVSYNGFTETFGPICLQIPEYPDNQTILSDFNITIVGDYPVLSWITLCEYNNAGWNIYRGFGEDNFDDAIQINPELIEGAGTCNEPTSYSYTDQHILYPGTIHYYWLEDVKYDGSTNLHPPTMVYIP
ncbi:MAG: Ig-like domain-containing protein [Candidatus Stygibacter australis]|nr:Ig-like domain-containing protein [Candidatus Stygibacter australis]MDP8321730.1 Ig-like domain-containing protein [Candidatus Stygibacter australis]